MTVVLQVTHLLYMAIKVGSDLAAVSSRVLFLIGVRDLAHYYEHWRFVGPRFVVDSAASVSEKPGAQGVESANG